MLNSIRWAVVTALVTLFVIGGCERQGPAERAGEEVDEAVGAIGEKAEEGAEQAQEQMEEMDEETRR